jgi:NADH-quinone oxidoreductase subunit L
MGGLKRELPVTYWTFLIGALAIAGVPGLAGFFSKDEILFRTFTSGHTLLWAVGVLTSLLTATYMFRLVFMAFHGERRLDGREGLDRLDRPEPADAHAHVTDSHGHGHAAPGHDAPPAMAIALVVLAVGSILAGYIGIPHALGGSNQLEGFLAPSFHAGAQAAVHGQTHASIALEFALMGISTLAAFAGIGLAMWLFLKRTDRADALAARFAPLHRLLLNKYYVDEIYDTAIVQPIKRISAVGLWRGVDAVLIDGTVNGTGTVIRGGSFALRRLQSGSMRTYAASLVLGVVMILGYYLWW